MTLKGTFETFNISTIFQIITSDRKTGVLRVSKPGNTVKVYFQEGMIVYATSTLNDTRLGYLLLNNKAIAPKELADALEISKTEKQALGKILVRQQRISPEMLRKFLYQQAINAIYDIFLWERGDFEYKDLDLNLDNMVIRNINTMGLMLEATRRIDDMAYFRQQIPHDQVVLARKTSPDESQQAEFSASEQAILALIDGASTVRDLVLKSGYDEYTVYRDLNTLLINGWIRKSDALPPRVRAARAFMQLQEIDSKIVRQTLDALGLPRSSTVRSALTRIARATVDVKEFMQAIEAEAKKIYGEEDREALDRLRKENSGSFVEHIACLLWERVCQG